MKPSISDSRMICQMAMWPAYIRAASASAWNMDRTCVQTTRRCRSNRSTSTPANGAMTNVAGSCPQKSTRPNWKDDPVNRNTTHDMAICCIHVPISEMLWPMKKSRKLRCCNDRKSSRHRDSSPELCLASVIRPVCLRAPRQALSQHPRQSAHQLPFYLVRVNW